MKNTITLTIPFSFKGKEHTPSAQIDLDIFCQQDQDMSVLCHLVATTNKIGNYSYEYEVLHASELHFSDATGIAKNHLSNGKFDLESFKESLVNTQVSEDLQTIAKQTMKIDNLEEHETLKLALEQAYQAGKKR